MNKQNEIEGEVYILQYFTLTNIVPFHKLTHNKFFLAFYIWSNIHQLKYLKSVVAG